MTIQEFHSRRIPKIHYSATTTPMHTIADFYNTFLIGEARLPDKDVVEQWHDLLVRYVNDPTSHIFPVRKYESNKRNGRWNNRRGAVVQFADGFEIVYASNFLAHEIFLMACRGFVPTDSDFRQALENRTLPITNGTEIEKQISLYPSANKTCGCYLAHIMDVNGQYERDDGRYLPLSSAEVNTMYPLGTASNWTSASDTIYHLNDTLNLEEKALVKAHFLRFLDPMNYYVTPETKHCKHSLSPWAAKKNIGEYPALTYYVQEQYKALYGARYTNLLALCRFREVKPSGYTGRNPLDLEIDFSLRTAKRKTGGAKPPASTTSYAGKFTYIPSNMGDFKTAFIKKGYAQITITYNDGSTGSRTWTCKKITQTSNIKGNLTSQSWYRDNKDRIANIVCDAT